MKTKLEQAFLLCVGHDELRPSLHKPFIQDGFIYATDANILIRCREEVCDFMATENLEAPNASAVIPRYNQDKPFSLDDATFENHKTTYEYEECDICGGVGRVDWEFQYYSKEDDCPECDGRGTSRVSTGVKTFPLSSVVKINDSYIRIGLFYKLHMLHNLIGGRLSVISQSESHRAVLFQVGICEILLMPLMYSKDDGGKVLEITI